MSESTLDLVRAVLAKGSDASALAKAATFVNPGSATVGLQSYNLEGPAKRLYPVLTPIRNRTPRKNVTGGLQANWKAITQLNQNTVYAGVSEGRRGSMIQYAMKEYNAAFRTIGLESAVTMEAELSAEGYEDLRASAQSMLMQAMFIEEEQVLLGGNTTLQLGVTPTPTLVASTTGGAIAAATVVSVIAVALTFDGLRRSNTLNGVLDVIVTSPTDGVGTIPVGGGSAQRSAAANVTTSGGGAASVVATVAPVRGAYGYAFFWGPVGAEKLGAVQSTSQLVITTAVGAAAANQLASSVCATDNSTSTLMFDGLLGIAGNAAFGSNVVMAAPGAGLTSDGVGGIVEFDNMLQYMWDKLRLTPSRIMVSSQETKLIRSKIESAGGSSSATRFVFNVQQGQITGGGAPKGYINPFSMAGASELPIELHPNMPPGTVLFETDTLPYPANGVDQIKRVITRRDVYSLEWPLRTRMYEYGVYSDEVLQHYYPPSMGVLTNLSNV